MGEPYRDAVPSVPAFARLHRDQFCIAQYTNKNKNKNKIKITWSKRRGARASPPGSPRARGTVPASRGSHLVKDISRGKKVQQG